MAALSPRPTSLPQCSHYQPIPLQGFLAPGSGLMPQTVVRPERHQDLTVHSARLEMTPIPFRGRGSFPRSVFYVLPLPLDARAVPCLLNIFIAIVEIRQVGEAPFGAMGSPPTRGPCHGHSLCGRRKSGGSRFHTAKQNIWCISRTLHL